MMHTQWRRHKRNKKYCSKARSTRNNSSVKATTDVQKEKKPVKLRLFPSIPPVVENEPKVSIGLDE